MESSSSNARNQNLAYGLRSSELALLCLRATSRVITRVPNTPKSTPIPNLKCWHRQSTRVATPVWSQPLSLSRSRSRCILFPEIRSWVIPHSPKAASVLLYQAYLKVLISHKPALRSSSFSSRPRLCLGFHSFFCFVFFVFAHLVLCTHTIALSPSSYFRSPFISLASHCIFAQVSNHTRQGTLQACSLGFSSHLLNECDFIVIVSSLVILGIGLMILLNWDVGQGKAVADRGVT